MLWNFLVRKVGRDIAAVIWELLREEKRSELAININENTEKIRYCLEFCGPEDCQYYVQIEQLYRRWRSPESDWSLYGKLIGKHNYSGSMTLSLMWDRETLHDQMREALMRID